ncbi:sigma-70 family RNA polymerase sigma factor [uncultured Draconibacterium sp.]|uniref:RNA polymerase sigma factor n=1 Tax=uncultured Draconibacterium sp. TaxID=1573823 RepID=UPI003217D059
MQLFRKNRNRKQLDDQELLSIYLNEKDFEVLGELYSRYMHLVYGVCLKYFKNAEISKDAVIEIYEKIQTGIHKHDINNFKSWLYVVTKNHCLMELRKNSGTRLLVSSDNELANFMENTPDLHPIDEEQNEAMEKALTDCIKKLKAEQKSCIRLFYYENKCYREIASELKLEEKKVKSFIQNGKRNLKICLEKGK